MKEDNEMEEAQWYILIALMIMIWMLMLLSMTN